MKSSGRLWLSILFVLALVAVCLIGFFTGSLKPILGLDLEGGVSAVLKAPDGTPQDVMEQALENIRNRVDSLGVAEPEIFLTGTSIEVQLPGLAKGTIDQRPKTQYCLLQTDGTSVQCEASQDDATSALSAATVKTQVSQVCVTGPSGTENLPCFSVQSDADTALKGITAQKQGTQYCLTDANATTYGCFSSNEAATKAQSELKTQATKQYCLDGLTSSSPLCFDTEQKATAALHGIHVQKETQQFCVVSSDGKDLGCYLTHDAADDRLQQTGQERLLELIGTTARLEEREVLETISPGTSGYDSTPVTCPKTDTVEPQCTFQKLSTQPVVFEGKDGTKYRLGPVEITGDAIKKATAVYGTGQSGSPAGWLISFQLTPDGAKKFGEVTTRLAGQSPQGQLAIIVDQVVVSAPTVQSPITGGNGQITGSFTEQQAKDLATVLNAGALPVQLARQQVVTVSPTLGQESLHQGIIAALVGLIALFLYLLFYYRLLGLVAWAGMLIWATLAIGLISLAGIAFGYSLTLAGVAGLVISLGVTADSYIVFFERLKDEVRNGKTPRSAVRPAFDRAFKTIVAADIVTGIAAAVLYITAVSSVRGFALTLGVSTMLDLFVVYFFKRPTVFLIARNPKLVNLRGFGLRSGVAGDPDPVAEPVPVAGGSR